MGLKFATSECHEIKKMDFTSRLRLTLLLTLDVDLMVYSVE